MATYYPTSSDQRDSTPMLYLREPLSNSYPESPPVLPNNSIMMYTPNYASSSMTENSEQQNNCVDITSMGTSNSVLPHQEILSNLGGDFNGWRDGGNEMVFMNPMASSSQNMLSLSLGTQMPPTGGLQISPSVQFRNPNSAFSSFLSPPHMAVEDEHFHGGDQNPTRIDQCIYGVPNIGRDVSNSKYLKAAQKLLDEVVHVWKAGLMSGNSEKKKACNDGGDKEESAIEQPQGDSDENSHHEISASDRQELHDKLTKLLTMLDEVDRQYKQYYHQMQIVVSSFDSIAGYGAAKPYTALALQTISRHFRCLRDAITGQIRMARRNLGESEVCTNGGKGVGISRLRYVDQQLRQHRALHQLGMMQQHTWRPQRGLPETSVTYLRAWLFEHFLHPYPKDSDKTMLARQTGLTRSQVSNWFINARVRLWKPMVEEMYKEETGDGGMMDSNSSSDNASKEATMAEQQSTTTTTITTTSTAGQFLPNHNPISEASTGFQNGNRRESESQSQSQYGMVKFREDMEECGIYQHAIGMDGFTGFGNGGGVSLTLGLQHCDEGGLPMHMAMRGDDDDMYTSNAAAGEEPGSGPGIGPGFDCLDNEEEEQQRFGSSHLLHDFVDYGGR